MRVFRGWFQWTKWRPCLRSILARSRVLVCGFCGQKYAMQRILSLILVTVEGFGLVIWFIDHIQVVTTNKYNTVAVFHTTHHSTLELSLLSLVFVTALSNDYTFTVFSLSVSWQRILTQELWQRRFRYHCATAHVKSHIKSQSNSFDCRLPEFWSTMTHFKSRSRILCCTPLLRRCIPILLTLLYSSSSSSVLILLLASEFCSLT
jgi:hypothetical protein